ncbi:MAG: hypothetical protein ABIJ08_02765 [Nanoarchaeota archaeon]
MSLESKLKDIGDIEKRIGEVVGQLGRYIHSLAKTVDMDSKMAKLEKERSALTDQLENYFKYNEHYSIKYYTAIVLDKTYKQDNRVRSCNLRVWAKDLRSRILEGRGTKNQRIDAVKDAAELYKLSGSAEIKGVLTQTYNSEWARMTARLKMGLFEEMKFIYDMREESGKPFSMWLKRHPLATSAILGGAAIAGIVGYALLKYTG